MRGGSEAIGAEDGMGTSACWPSKIPAHVDEKLKAFIAPCAGGVCARVRSHFKMGHRRFKRNGPTRRASHDHRKQWAEARHGRYEARGRRHSCLGCRPRQALLEKPGWRLDADFVRTDGSRAVQLTPPGSPASIQLGTGSGLPLFLIVNDIEAARLEFIARGVDVSEAFHRGPQGASRVRIGSGRATARSPRSAMMTAITGCFSKSPSACPDA